MIELVGDDCDDSLVVICTVIVLYRAHEYWRSLSTGEIDDDDVIFCMFLSQFGNDGEVSGFV